MDFLRILGICVLVLGLSQCRRKSNPVESEVREAGYEMTAEGWFNAIKGNDVAVMKKMVGGDFDDKTKNAEGKSGLHMAAAAGSMEAGEYLLNRGHSVDAAGPEGRTPLMEAVLADHTEMIKWLLRQGADPKIKDNGGFMALMLATTEGKPASVEELAPYNREDLDSALLLAALVGKAEVIDVLTNYGASVYARMEDGRTALMLAAQNGHEEAASLLIDIGASRFATTEEGDTAQSFAVAAGHNEIAALIESGFAGDSLAFETDEEVAEAMEEYVEEFEAAPEGTVEDGGQVAVYETGDEAKTPLNNPVEAQGDGTFGRLPDGDRPRSAGDGALIGAAVGGIVGDSPPVTRNESSQGLDGARIGDTEGGIAGRIEPAQGTVRDVELAGSPVSRIPRTLAGARIGKPKAAPVGGDAEAPATDAEIPLVMRHYRQRELPVEVRKVSGGVASLRIAGPEPKEVQVRAGEAIPQSNLVVVKVFNRTDQGKLNNSQPMEVGIVEVEDTASGQRREWIAGMPASGHDPVALVEDAATGQRYVAKPGQRFTSEDGREFMVNDVRPGQLVIEDTASGEVRTLPLRGPRG